MVKLFLKAVDHLFVFPVHIPDQPVYGLPQIPVRVSCHMPHIYQVPCATYCRNSTMLHHTISCSTVQQNMGPFFMPTTTFGYLHFLKIFAGQNKLLIMQRVFTLPSNIWDKKYSVVQVLQHRLGKKFHCLHLCPGRPSSRNAANITTFSRSSGVLLQEAFHRQQIERYTLESRSENCYCYSI